MDIPLPGEIPLPGGGGDDNQPGPPGEGPPSRQRLTGRRNFRGSNRPQGPQRVQHPNESSPALIPPPMFQGPVPPFMRGPPPNAMPEESSSQSASERYSPSRVTGDDDEKEQLSISAIFAEEQNLQNSSQRPPASSSQWSSQPQQSISAIFDSFLTPPPQANQAMPPQSHEQPHRNQYPPPMHPQYPMGGQHPMHHGQPNSGPPRMPGTGGHPRMPGTGGHPRMPGTGGPPRMPGTGGPLRMHGTGGPPNMHSGPPGTGPHGVMPPHPPGGHPAPYMQPPPYQPYTSAPVSHPPFAPSYTPAPSNKGPRHFRSAMRPPFRGGGKFKAAKILKAFNAQNVFNTQGKFESPGPEGDVASTLDTFSPEGRTSSNSKISASESVAADSTVTSLSSEIPTPEDSEQGKTETQADDAPPGEDVTKAPARENVASAPPAEDAASGPPGENTTIAPPGENSSIAPPGENLTSASQVENSVIAPPGENLTSASPVENSSIAPPGENITTEATPVETTVSSSKNISLSAAEMAAKLAIEMASKSTANSTVNSSSTLSDKPVKKVMPKVLGKHGAKKRLLSYTGKLSGFSLAKTTKPTTPANLDEDDENADKKKAIVQAKKKKKEEKMSSIEQIRNEESRLKEALGLKNVLFSPYGPGLAPIAKLLDNPEELKKFEYRGKQAKVRLEEYEVRSKIREEEEKREKLEREKEREKKYKEREDKEKERNTDKVVEETKIDEPDGTGEESTVVSTPKVEQEEEKKSFVLPKTWKEFKKDNYDFETLKRAMREETRKRFSRRYERSRSSEGYSRDRRDSRQDGRESRQDETTPYEQQQQLHSVPLKTLNGMRLQYPAKLVQYTKTHPVISYGINYHRFAAHFSSRTEIKVKESPETYEIFEEFWSAKPVYPSRKKHGKGKEMCRPWFAETLEGKSELKTKVEPDIEEEEKQKKTEKKSKKSHSRLKTIENQYQIPRTIDVKGKEVAKSAAKSRWDSDEEKVDLYSGIGLEDESVQTPPKSDHKISTEEDTITENDLISSDNNTNNVEGEAPAESSGKPFPEGLNEEYEAFLEILGGESEPKDHEKEGEESFIREMESRSLTDRDDEKMDDERDLDGYEVEKDKYQEDPLESEEVKARDGSSELVQNKVKDKKKEKADKKLKKQLKKAKKKQKKAKKKAKKKVKKLTKKKKVPKKDKEAKKSEKKAAPVEINEMSEVLDIPENDNDEQGYNDDDKENFSGRRRRDSGSSKDPIDERHRGYSDRRRDSEDRSSAERSEYSERRRRDSPDRRGSHDRRRGYEDNRDFNYRREGRGYYRGRGGDWRREDFGDHRGRFRGRGGYDRRGRGRGFGRGFRDRRDSFRERRLDDDERMYERTEDYEVHREFIREKRDERKEALEEGRDLRQERIEKRKRQRYQREEGEYYSPARTISDESDSDIQSIDPNEEVEERMKELENDDDKIGSTKRRKEKRIPSPAPSPLSSPSSSPDRSRIANEETLIEEGKVGEKSERFGDVEVLNTSPSMKSREPSPNQSIEIIEDEKKSDSASYKFSDTSGYYDLSSAPSLLSEPGSAQADENLESSKKKQRNSKDLEFKLDDIPYPPVDSAVDHKRRDLSKGSQSLSDRYSPSNMSMFESPDATSPYNSPRNESPSLEIPLPPLQTIPVPPLTNKISTVEFSKFESLPLPSSSSLRKETTEIPNVITPKPVPAAIPGKTSGSPLKSSSILSQLSALQSSSGPSSTSEISSLVSASGVSSLSSPVLAAISKAFPEMKESVTRPFAEGLESSETVLSPKFHDSLKSLFPANVATTASNSEPDDTLEPKQPYNELKDDIRNDKPSLKSDYTPTKWVEKSVDESHIDSPSIEEVKSSRSMPITFRLGGSKQATIKRLQMGAALAGFDEEEEEEKIGLDLDRGVDEDKTEFDSESANRISEGLPEISEYGPPPSSTEETLASATKDQLQDDVREREGLDSSRSRSLEKEQSLRGSLSPQRNKDHSHKDMSPPRSPSRERSKSPKSTRSHYKSRTPPRNRSPVRSRSPQRNRSPKRNRSPRRSRDSRSRSLSPRRMGGRRSPPRKRRISPEYKRYRGSPDRGRRREFGSPRRSGHWPRDGRSPPPRGPGSRSAKDRSPKKFSRSPSPIKGDRYTSPDSRRSRTPEKLHASAVQGPRTPEGHKFSRSPPRSGSPHRDREFRGNYKEKLGSRSPNRPPSPESLGRRSYASPPRSRKISKEYRSSRSPGSRSPERWPPRRHSPSRRSPSWSPSRKRGGSPFRKSPPLQKSRGRSPYSPGRDKGSPLRRWSPRRSRSPRRSPLRKSPLRRPLKRRSTSRSPALRSRSRSPVRRSTSRSPIRRSPLRRSPRWSRSPGRRSPVRRSPVRRSPLRRSPGRSPLRRSPIRRSPLRRSPLRRSPSRKSPVRKSPIRKSPIRKSPRRSPRSSRSPSKDFDFEHRERGGWSNWKWDKEKEEEHKDKERWPVRPPSPKEEPPLEKYYKNKADQKEGTLKIDADSTISDSELVIKKEPADSPSPSPHSSPQRLSLDERLQQEHGLDLEDKSKKKVQQQPSHPPVYNWGYQAHPVQVHQFQYAYEGNSEGGTGEGGSGDGSSRVIQVGNMLQVLPQDGAPGNMLQVLPQDGNPANPSPMIVQTGNVIQVVPAENMQMIGTDVVSGIPVSSSGVMGMGGVVQVVTGNMMGVPGSSPTPVPAPTSSSSATSKSAVSEDTVAAVSSVLSSLSSIQLPGASLLSSATSQPSQTPATAATNSVTATTSAHAPGLPVAHLISLLQQQQQMASMNESAADQEALAAAKEKSREARRERKEKRRLERETRREARQKEKEAYRLKKEQETKKKTEENNSDTEDEVLIREAMYEVPTIGSPVPDYEIMKDDDDDDDEEEAMLKKKRRLPIPLPPAEKGILMSPSYRYRDEYHPKAVKFADGILPGEGTSPSGGEEIQSPPPPGNAKPKEKKLKKRRKVKVKMIKEYKVNDEGDDSPPPPPPGSPPPLAALKLYPGHTHYSYSAPGTVVIYAQQPQQAYAYASGQTQGTITVPSGMVIQPGTNTQPTQAAVGSLGGVSPGVFRYPGYVYTTVYPTGQQLQYVLPSSVASQPASAPSSSSPKKKSKK